MKKPYNTPRAEKLEFNYTKVVVASNENNKPKYNDDPNGKYYKCLSTDYWGC